MRLQTNGSRQGRHRKSLASQSPKGRIAFVAVAAGAVSGAGVSGATAVTVQKPTPEFTNPSGTVSPNVQLSSSSSSLDPAVLAAQAAPQILAIPDLKPADGLFEQLRKAVTASQERAAEDAARRVAPVVKPAEGVFTSGFGMRWGVLHAGIDIANAIGTPILSVMDGTVIDAGPAAGYGNWIRIRNDDGSVAVYGHMETIEVSVGQRVMAGQKIAGMGNRGFSTGSHLHFEIHPNGGVAVDPIPWFAERGVFIS